MSSVFRRLKPFLDLLDAKYLPLLFIASPQAYTVYRWLWEGSHQTDADFVFSILGSIGFEFVYVSAVVWSQEKPNRWVWFTSASALLFSVGIAIRVYWVEEEWWSFLHIGYPLISYFYSMTVHHDGMENSTNGTAENEYENRVRETYKSCGNNAGKAAMKLRIKKAEVERILGL